MNCEHIIARRRECETELRAREVHAAVFGSTARGNHRSDSDVDIFIDIDSAALIGGYEHVGIKQLTADLLAGPVDVVEHDSLRGYVHPSVMRDALYAF